MKNEDGGFRRITSVAMAVSPLIPVTFDGSSG